MAGTRLPPQFDAVRVGGHGSSAAARRHTPASLNAAERMRDSADQTAVIGGRRSRAFRLIMPNRRVGSRSVDIAGCGVSSINTFAGEVGLVDHAVVRRER